MAVADLGDDPRREHRPQTPNRRDVWGSVAAGCASIALSSGLGCVPSAWIVCSDDVNTRLTGSTIPLGRR